MGYPDTVLEMKWGNQVMIKISLFVSLTSHMTWD